MSEKEIQELIGKADELLVNNELEKAQTLFARVTQARRSRLLNSS